MAISQLAIEVILDGFSRVGLDGAAIAERAGILTRAAPRVDANTLEALWREALRRTRRSSIPFEVGLHTPEAAFGLIYYLTSAASTLGAGMALLARSLPLATPWLQLSIEERGEERGSDEVVVAFVNQPRFPGRDDTELFILGLLVRRLQSVPVHPVRPVRIELPLRAPSDRAAWSRLVDATPLRFGARVARLVLRREDWDVPLRRADPRLLELLARQLGLSDGPHDALLAALRVFLRDRLDRLPELAEAAAVLGMSTRSLQRRLGAADTTFERELDQVRREVAEWLLAQRRLSLGEVATRLGFAEQASFTRAYLRWTGITPSSARRHLLGTTGYRTPPDHGPPH